MEELKRRIEQLEQSGGESGETGFKVFSVEETARLFNFYRDLQTRLEYLNYGKMPDLQEWEGYPLLAGGIPYESEQIFAILNELKKDKLPPVFLANFRIYLLPYEIKGISGLGGPGFALISASSGADRSYEQLRATLLHELGHHIHSSFISSENPEARELWNRYLKLRGGKWHGPGRVNTTAWSNSSEETFAEDFRMLFGRDQPFYGDISLGDPRANPETAARVRDFILDLQKQKILEKTGSPWIPEGMGFWSYSHIFAGWLKIAAGIFTGLFTLLLAKAYTIFRLKS